MGKGKQADGNVYPARYGAMDAPHGQEQHIQGVETVYRAPPATHDRRWHGTAEVLFVQM
jgi:hypothetical protein